ncbi:MATE family efflux transporter [Cohaesibacter haloalkalitolerans]|uniref:MATE family efflux transporter n=1 Tax=Cohaesibacter haloalkalitolerans TaxID=1162980 RepID=UPI000E6575F1|nr:MATE family efflux transporter [Cohaesibacter haloalkalitolerans]
MQDQQPVLEGQSHLTAQTDSNSGAPISWRGEAAATLALAWPLVLAQLAQFSLQITDVVMMGWIGRDALAAGSLASALMHPVAVFGIGALSAVSPMVAQAIGAKDETSVRRSARQGIWVAFVISVLIMALLYQGEYIYRIGGQMPDISAKAAGYLNFAALGVFPSLGFVALRSLVTAHGETRVILLTTIASFFVNFAGNYVLMFGKFGFPELGLIGAGISTSVVQTFVFVLLVAYVLRKKSYKKYNLLFHFWKPDWPRFFELFRVGIPIGLMVMVEVGLFAAAVFLMGWISTDALAAHTVAIQLASLAFMVPLGLSQAITVRTGLAYGARCKEGVRRAGWVAVVISALFNSLSCFSFLVFPHFLVGLYLDPTIAANTVPYALAVSYLAYAGLFQLVDGLQSTMAGALRGLSDTKVPMFIAVFGYWVCGLPISYFCAFKLGWEGEGIWVGLAAGLAITAMVLTYRFVNRERLGLVNFDHLVIVDGPNRPH